VRLDFQIRGDKELQQQFLTAESRLRVYCRAVLALYGAQIQAKASALAPKGKTGQLAASVRTKPWENASSIRQYTKARKFYSRFVEEGIQEKSISVPGYTRRSKGGDLRLGGKKRGRITAMGVGFVSGYTKRAHQKAQAFMLPSWLASKAGLEEALRDAAVRAITEGK
jgi:hypothetical protein